MRSRPVLAYLLLVAALIGAFAQTQRIASTTKRADCLIYRRIWDVSNETAINLTEHVTLSPTVAKFSPDIVAPLKVQLEAANARRDAERDKLLQLQGAKPVC